MFCRFYIRARSIPYIYMYIPNLLNFSHLYIKCGNVCKSVECKTLIFRHLHFVCGNVPQFSTLLQSVPKV